MAEPIWRDSVLSIVDFSRARDTLRFTFGLDDHRFETILRYSSVDFDSLEDTYGREFLHSLYFHIGAFEANKLASLKPATFELGPFADCFTSEFEALWRSVFQNVWAQWQYENNAPDYAGPRIANSGSTAPVHRVRREGGALRTLSFCGGGKDSLVAMGLLDGARVDYDSFVYSILAYGPESEQHALVDALLRHGRQKATHRLYVTDDFFLKCDKDMMARYGVKTVTAAETPASVFAAIPISLQHGFGSLVVGHERSANVGNMVWQGRQVNHQWGKSFEAERLLSDYVTGNLVQDLEYFSVLMPIHDALIFNMLRRTLDAVPDAHSCNVKKPWCGRCPKCAYVFLNYSAYLPADVVARVFDENLFDLQENELAYRQMIGLEDHTPFECIGQIEESRLAFEICRRRGVQGDAVRMFSSQFPAYDATSDASSLLSVGSDIHAMPAGLSETVLNEFRLAAEEAQRFCDGILAP